MDQQSVEDPGDRHRSSLDQQEQRQAISFADVDPCGKAVPMMSLPRRQEGWASRHPGLAAVRRRRQPLTRSPPNLSSECSPGAVEMQEMAAAALCKLDNKRFVQPSPPPTTCCGVVPGGVLHPSREIVPKAKQGDEVGGRRGSTPIVKGMEEFCYTMCTPVDSRGIAAMKTTYAAQPAMGMRQKVQRMSHHQATCHGGGEICVKRPSYGFGEDSRPTCCSSHKETGMEDLISARCSFTGCRTIASYGVQVPGSHVIRRTRCKAHGTSQMMCATKGLPCRAPGDCKTRPSYGWPNKLTGEHRARPERCKMHLLPAMEYMGSSARAKKRRQLEMVKQPVKKPPHHPDTHRRVRRPFFPVSKLTPWTHSTCKSAAISALILEPVLGDIMKMDATEDPPEAGRARCTHGCMRRWPDAGRELLAASESSTEEQASEGWTMQWRELKEHGDQGMLPELEQMEESTKDEMGLFIRPCTPELADMAELDALFPSSWGRLDSPDIGAILQIVNDAQDLV
ncbi:hypothetical protein KFL_001050240 [Klebsormidium nitens]|uniref:Uncharacterized protein n=1 Tax=Klebsormidium nitens TaxID=105231 RepID=A0A1Y1HZA5_KLENI|nr:hypothetical protein KFL_001050240 [Klebsormidium nitens]|eukprot:GAQ82261.1 hypothetical protein KFL_001050240 [Klebsormidium nitens]